MSTENRLNNRIPFEQVDAATHQWELPSLGAGRVVPSVKKKSASDPKSQHETIEQLETTKVKPLTAAEMSQMVEQAEQEGRQIGFTQGFEQGYKEGELKGKQLGEKKAYEETKQALMQAQETFEALCGGLFNPVETLHQQLEHILLDLVIQSTRHLVGDVVAQHPALMLSVIHKAIGALPVGEHFVKVYIHPDDLKIIRQQAKSFKSQWEFVADMELSRGGIKIETDHSLIDFSVEQRLNDWIQQSRLMGHPAPDASLELIAYPDITAILDKPAISDAP